MQSVRSFGLSLSPTSPKLLLVIGLVLSASLQWEQVCLAEAPVVQTGVTRSTLYTAGVQAYRQGDYAGALRYFREVLSEEGSNVNAHYYLALSMDNLGRGQDAIPDYRFVISHSDEAPLIDFAKTRLKALETNPSVKAEVVDSEAFSSKAGDLALIASGQRVAPVVYRGLASQVAVPLKNSKNALVVDAFIHQEGNQEDGVFIIDTGATYTSISRDMAERLGIDLTHCETVFITTANGRIEVPKVTLQKLNVNGLEAYNVEATVIPLRKESSFSGLLGLSFIRQFVLTIDPQANQLIFRRN